MTCMEESGIDIYWKGKGEEYGLSDRQRSILRTFSLEQVLSVRSIRALGTSQSTPILCSWIGLDIRMRGSGRVRGETGEGESDERVYRDGCGVRWDCERAGMT